MKHKLSIIRVIFLAIAFGASYTASAQYMQRFDISDSNRLQKVTPLDVDNDGLIDIVKMLTD